MLKSINFLLFLILIVNISFTMSKNSKKISKDDSIYKSYDFSEIDIFGKEKISLSKYKGKVILLNFWATWCPPCRMEIPDFVELYKNYSNKLIIIGISLDESGVENVKKFYEYFKMNYPVIMGTRDIVIKFGGITAIPTSFIIDKNGEIVKKLIGFRNKDQILEEIKNYL